LSPGSCNLEKKRKRRRKEDLQEELKLETGKVRDASRKNKRRHTLFTSTSRSWGDGEQSRWGNKNAVERKKPKLFLTTKENEAAF